jgi:hypothetical protein
MEANKMTTNSNKGVKKNTLKTPKLNMIQFIFEK